jgi:LPXTG-site transpeptidase (sortase) family protein
MRKWMSVLKWGFISLGVLLVGLGASVGLGLPIATRLVEPVSAAIDPASAPWDQFDPYLVSVTAATDPNQTNLPDTYDENSQRSLLNETSGPVDDGPVVPPDRLVIPSIDLDAPVVITGVKKYNINGNIYQQWIVPDEFAAGWNPASSAPGRPGNVVLFGHHNVNGAVFANLYQLEADDQISVFADGLEYRYQVDQVLKVKEKDVSFAQMVENGQYISQTEDDRLTLVTCWPPYASTYRLIVIAKPAALPSTAR